jgi:hypothetical protein
LIEGLAQGPSDQVFIIGNEYFIRVNGLPSFNQLFNRF